MDPKPEEPKLRIVKFFDDETPYTVFVALTTDEFADVIEDGTGNLAEYKRKIVSVVEGHAPTVDQRLSAREAFIRVHSSARGPAADRDELGRRL